MLVVTPPQSRQGYYMNQGYLYVAPIIQGTLDRELEMMVDYWELTPEEFEEAMTALNLLESTNE